jgi:hypothetical protein
VFLFAIPGLILLGLSILAVLVSILALLLLTVPVYRLLSAATGATPSAGQYSSPQDPQSTTRMEPPAPPDGDVFVSPADASPPPNRNRRHVDVKIIEPQQ